MDVSDFAFELPERLVAQQPVEPRDSSRLLVYERSTARVHHRRFSELGEFLVAGDLLVLNDTRVQPWRLVGRRATGGRAECLILERNGPRCRGYLKPARKMRPGERVELEDGALWLLPRADLGDGMWEFDLGAEGALDEALERAGRAPLPPYIRRDGGEDRGLDRERYQTVFAAHPGAVAAPTAGLHFTPGLLAALASAGVEQARVTLHVGEGTFAPVRVEEVEAHAMHRERYELSEATAARVAATRVRGGRVVAVGTTSARVLETCARTDRTVAAGTGESDLFLYPGVPLQVVDALLTNFHLPRSTLLMLVAAFAGREEILRVYREAIDQGYRFYSYGDAMLIL